MFTIYTLCTTRHTVKYEPETVELPLNAKRIRHSD